MHDDDLPVGRLLTRREALTLLGGAGLLLLSGCKDAAAPAGNNTTCVVRPEETEGPYFVDEKLNRSDIRTDPSDSSVRPGAQLDIAFNVSRVVPAGCTPLVGALVDVWHCDAAGVYSDVNDPGFNTQGKKFLRGYQATDANGRAAFSTIYPGWYSGRAVHIHFKIRTTGATSHEFISQLYFDDTLTDTVHALAPYSAKGQRSDRNSDDGIYKSGGGSQLVLAVTNTAGTYSASFDIAVENV